MNDTDLIFSVIVPVYNMEKSVKRCIDSVLHQDFPGFELLIIDDGSLDDSLKVITELSKTDDRITVFTKENGGVSSARNMGIKNAQGQWLVFADADDELEKECLWLFYNNRSDVDIIVANENLKAAKVEVLDDLNTQKLIYEMVDPRIESEDYISSPCSKAYKRSMVEKAGILFDEQLTNGEDTIFNVSALIHAGNVCFINEKGYKIYYNPDSATKSYHKKILDTDQHFLLKLKEILQNFNIFSEELYSAVVLNGFWVCMNLNIANSENPDAPTINQRKALMVKTIQKQPYNKEINNVSIHSNLSPLRKLIFLCIKYKFYQAAILLFLFKLSVTKYKT